LGNNGGTGVFVYVGPQEILELVFADLLLHIVEELEALFIWNFGESVIWGLAIKSWMNT